MRTAQSVQISGATGRLAQMINAELKATGESVNGAPVFIGKHDSSAGLWVGRDGNWWLGRVDEKGQNKGNAYVEDKASPLAENAVWKVWTGSGFADQMGVKLVRMKAPAKVSSAGTKPSSKLAADAEPFVPPTDAEVTTLH